MSLEIQVKTLFNKQSNYSCVRLHYVSHIILQIHNGDASPKDLNVFVALKDTYLKGRMLLGYIKQDTLQLHR
jgi:hypothetical protein